MSSQEVASALSPPFMPSTSISLSSVSSTLSSIAVKISKVAYIGLGLSWTAMGAFFLIITSTSKGIIRRESQYKTITYQHLWGKYSTKLFSSFACSGNYNFQKLTKFYSKSTFTFNSFGFVNAVCMSDLLFLSLTVLTLLNKNFQEDKMTIKDFYGEDHKLTRLTVIVFLLSSWLAFFLSLLLDVVYYKLHLSAVNLSPKKKNFIYIFGVSHQLLWCNKYIEAL